MTRITLNGTLGSGKSTIGKKIAERLNIRYMSTGQIFREIGHISNLDALQINLEAENNTSIDQAVDAKVQELNLSQESFVIDSRMAWHFVENATRVFLSVSPENAARRVLRDQARFNERYSSPAAALTALAARRESELRRYSNLYGVDIEDSANYDLHIITDDANIDDIVELILAYVRGQTKCKMWIPKTRIVPMITIRDASSVSHINTTDISDSFLVPLYVKDNFGFFFHGAQVLARALLYGRALVPYVSEIPAFVEADKYDPSAMARTLLRLSDLYDWEALSGIKLAFADELAEKGLHS